MSGPDGYLLLPALKYFKVYFVNCKSVMICKALLLFVFYRCILVETTENQINKKCGRVCDIRQNGLLSGSEDFCCSPNTHYKLLPIMIRKRYTHIYLIWRVGMDDYKNLKG